MKETDSSVECKKTMELENQLEKVKGYLNSLKLTMNSLETDVFSLKQEN